MDPGATCTTLHYSFLQNVFCCQWATCCHVSQHNCWRTKTCAQCSPDIFFFFALSVGPKGVVWVRIIWVIMIIKPDVVLSLLHPTILLDNFAARCRAEPGLAKYSPFCVCKARHKHTHTHTVSLTCVAAVIMRAKMTTWNKNVCGLRKRHILSFLDNLCLLSERNAFSRIIVWLWLGIRRLQCLIFVIVAQDDLLLKSTDCPISWGC